MKKLRGAIAVVTGAGGGIGRETSLELARRGCDLALADISDEGAQQTAEAVRRLGRKASVHRVDVADREQMQAFPDAVATEHGKINIVVQTVQQARHTGVVTDDPV